ncbi:MAG TPA: SPOR domain-containing protein [Saprospiraceae bacterium]|nr:SPOR domain-containing protein [Saprospiraceae bacterium]
MRLSIILFLFLTGAGISSAQSPSYFEMSYLEAKQKASKSNKLCAVVFTRDLSKSSAYFTEVAFEDPEVKKAVTDSYLIAASNVRDFDSKSLLKKWGLDQAPSIAIVNAKGDVVGTANYGMSKSELARFLQYYSIPANAGKKSSMDDGGFEGEVAAWEGFKGKDMDGKMAVNNPVTAASEAKMGIVPAATQEKPVENVQPPKDVEKEAIAVRGEVPVVAENNQAVAEKPKQEPKAVAPQTHTQPATQAKNPEPTHHDAGEYKFLVQAGIFSVETSARALVSKIEAQGGKAYIEPVVQPDKTVYKVIAGKYYTEKEARDFIAKLKDAGIASFIKPVN